MVGGGGRHICFVHNMKSNCLYSLLQIKRGFKHSLRIHEPLFRLNYVFKDISICRNMSQSIQVRLCVCELHHNENRPHRYVVFFSLRYIAEHGIIFV